VPARSTGAGRRSARYGRALFAKLDQDDDNLGREASSAVRGDGTILPDYDPGNIFACR
jgi:hypothetical protein